MHFELRFAEDSIQFQCQYPRIVNTGTQMTVTSSAPQSTIGVGEFSYTMDAQGGPIGGNTIVSINANHNFDGIVPR